MVKKSIVLVVALGVSGCSGVFNTAADEQLPGLVGIWYGSAQFTRPEEADVIDVIDMVWTKGNRQSGNWSGKWQGLLIGPTTGKVTIQVRTDQEASVRIGRTPIELKRGQEQHSAKVSMVSGTAYPIEISYSHTGGPAGYLKVSWSWTGQDFCPIAPKYLRHTDRQEKACQAEVPPVVEEPGTIPPLTAAGTHVVVYYKPGRFAGHPANNGVWSWGNEILVGFSRAYYKERIRDHSIDRLKPGDGPALGRSLDGGRTWTVETPQHPGDPENPAPCPGNINFAHPDLAMRRTGNHFRISYDRGKTWTEPYRFPDLGTDELIAHGTDYIVNGPQDCMFFLSAHEPRVEVAGLQDRAFCAQTADGGKTFKFLSWMTGEPIAVRSAYCSTVRISDNQLVSALRRSRDLKVQGERKATRCWIDVYCSDDNGKSWQFLSKVADTDTGQRNGNPPSLVRLKDGRLVVTYGYRAKPYGIRAKISSDNGKTWSEEIGLRLDGRTFDLGYPRAVVRPDGKLVTIYYYTTEERPEQHIVATIWDADSVSQE